MLYILRLNNKNEKFIHKLDRPLELALPLSTTRGKPCKASSYDVLQPVTASVTNNSGGPKPDQISV